MKEQDEFTPEHEAYLRREVQGGLEEIDRGEYASFDAESVIAEERQRMRIKAPSQQHPQP